MGLVFMLEGASSIASFVMFYGYTLDTSDRSELLQMVITNAFNLSVMVYTRWVHYWWSVFKCLNHFYAAGAYAPLVAGVVCGGGLMPYFSSKFIPQMWKKLLKFTQLYLEHDNEEPTGASLP